MKDQKKQTFEKQLSFDFQTKIENEKVEYATKPISNSINSGKIIPINQYSFKKERNYTNFIIKNTKSF